MAQIPSTPRRRRRSSSATIVRVAEAAGVSTATVSRVFCGTNAVRPKTRERVLQAARDVRYRPNPAARCLASGATGVLGLIVPDLTRPGDARFVQAALRRARAQGHPLVVADWADAPGEEALLAAELAQRTEGLLLLAPSLSAGGCAGLAETLPVVLAQRRIRPLPTVLVNERVRVARAIGHLRELGHERVAWVSHAGDSEASRDRNAALSRSQSGLSVLPLKADGTSFAHGQGLTTALLASGATAAVAFDDELALGLLAGLRDAGIEVPAELSVVGGDDTGDRRSRLTTVVSPLDEMGAAAVDLLLMAARGEEAAPALRTVRFDPRLEIRHSTGPRP